MTEGKKAAKGSERRARLSAALRENLKRRKAQARSRASSTVRAGAGAAPDAANERRPR